MVKPVIRTFTGRSVNPLDLRPEDIDILDIAHALSCVNRFAGHTEKPISVAQHSVYVSRLVDTDPNFEEWDEPLRGLLHDAAEAYLGDVTKWLKSSDVMAGYREAEHRAERVIAQAFGLDGSLMTESVEWADRVMVRFEGRHPHGFGKTFYIDHPNYPELTHHELTRVGEWRAWPWRRAKESFLTHFRILQQRRAR